jgi:hypothetical protein
VRVDAIEAGLSVQRLAKPQASQKHGKRMHRHRDLGQERIARVIDGEFADAFTYRQFARRSPSFSFQPGREVRDGRNHCHIVPRATSKMRRSLVNEDPQIGVNRIGEQTGKGQDSQRGSLAQLRHFRSLQQTDSSIISRNSDREIRRIARDSSNGL